MAYPHMPGFVVPYPLANGNAGTVLLGQPVYSSGAGKFDLAKANSLSTSVVIGVIGVDSVLPGAVGPIQSEDMIAQQTTAAWDALCGTSGGLTSGARYYLSPTTAGKYTATPPTTSGQFVVPVLLGLSPTIAQMLITSPTAANTTTQAFFYHCTGAEGDSFPVPLPAARGDTNYVAVVSLSNGGASHYICNAPSFGYTTTQITVVTGSPVAAEDMLAIVVTEIT